MRQKIVMTKSRRNLEEKYGKVLKSCGEQCDVYILSLIPVKASIGDEKRQLEHNCDQLNPSATVSRNSGLSQKSSKNHWSNSPGKIGKGTQSSNVHPLLLSARAVRKATNNSPFHAQFCSIALQLSLACMRSNFGLFCSFSPKLPPSTLGYIVMQMKKINREKGYSKGYETCFVMKSLHIRQCIAQIMFET